MSAIRFVTKEALMPKWNVLNHVAELNARRSILVQSNVLKIAESVWLIWLRSCHVDTRYIYQY